MWEATYGIQLETLQNLDFTNFVNFFVAVSELHFNFWLAWHKE